MEQSLISHVKETSVAVARIEGEASVNRLDLGLVFSQAGLVLLANVRQERERSHQTRCRARDGGRPSEAGLQEQASNNHKLRWSKARVVSVMEKARLDRVMCRSRRRTRVLGWKYLPVETWHIPLAPGRRRQFNAMNDKLKKDDPTEVADEKEALRANLVKHVLDQLPNALQAALPALNA